MLSEHEKIDQLINILNLQLVESDERRFQLLQERIDRIAQDAGVSSEKLQLPQRFLAQPLTDQQLQVAAEILGPDYAKRGVELQDLMMTLPIVESNQPMVSIQTLAEAAGLPVSFSKRPFPDACGEWAGKPRVFWVREQVGKQFIEFVKLATRAGFRVEVEDAFRPLGVQEGLFLRRVGIILDQHPEWIHQWDKVWAEARSKTAVYPVLAGHKSGAAIDVTLYHEDGQPLEIGNKYPMGSA